MVNYWDTAGTIDRTDLPAQSFSLPDGKCAGKFDVHRDNDKNFVNECGDDTD